MPGAPPHPHSIRRIVLAHAPRLYPNASSPPGPPRDALSASQDETFCGVGGARRCRQWLLEGGIAASLRRRPGADASVLSAKADPRLVAAARAAGSAEVPVIVRETAPRSDAAEALVRGVGGHVTHELPIVGSFSARIPGARITD